MKLGSEPSPCSDYPIKDTVADQQVLDFCVVVIISCVEVLSGDFVCCMTTADACDVHKQAAFLLIWM